MTSARRQQGQALIVMMVFVILASLHAVLSRQEPARSQFQRPGDDALARAKEALLWYAITYRDTHEPEVAGYLPCPDTGEEGLFAAGNGIASSTCGAPGEISVGLLPYRTLGLPDLRDANGDCLWYAVSGNFKAVPKAGVPLNWDTQGQLAVIDAGGVRTAPDDADGGAAAIVFSPGPALPGQARRPTGRPCSADPSQITAFLESVPPSFAAGDATNARGETTRNDRLSWVTPREIFDRIIARADFHHPLGSIPEGRINQLIDAQQKALEGRLWASMSALTAGSTGLPGASAMPANAADYAQFAAKRLGDVPDLMPVEYRRRNLDRDFENWREQFRYVVCDDLRPFEGCLLAAAGRRCRGALLFGGRGVGGAPRPASARPLSPPSSRSAWLSHYFESGALELLDGPALSFATAGRYEAANPAADVGVCLLSGGYTSFAKDIAGYMSTASSTLRPEAAVDVAARTLTLGNPATAAAGSGCAWFATPLPFAGSLRAYFKLRIADAGEGLTLAVIDGDRNAKAMETGGPCGNPVGAQLGYSGPQLVPPKFGLEIDTRAQSAGNCGGNNRNDPSSQHMAFVFWGTSAADSDDNCHGAGTPGSGAQPLNPRVLGGGIATVHASDPHLPYSGSLPLNMDVHVRLDATKTYDGVPVAAARWSAADGMAVLVTEAPHGLVSGQRVTVSGMNPPAYDGTVVIDVEDDVRLSYAVPADPGVHLAGGHIAPPPAVAVVGAQWASGTVTLATEAPHGFVDGQPVTLAGSTPDAYNGSYAVEVVDASRLRIAMAANPGPYVSGGSLSPAAALHLRAYVASRFLVFSHAYVSTCTVANFRDLSQDLDALCTQDYTLLAENVPIDTDPTTGRALPRVYVGFTAAQATGAAGRQRLTIADFLANAR